VKENLNKHDIPNTILQMDSMEITPETFKDVTFDIIFQDGCHCTEHVLYELETLYPQIKEDGKGYFLMHDAVGPSEEAWRIIRQQIKEGKYDFEYVVLSEIYGLGIFRKMEGYDYNKKRWVE
jgi:hypothetical protein